MNIQEALIISACILVAGEFARMFISYALSRRSARLNQAAGLKADREQRDHDEKLWKSGVKVNAVKEPTRHAGAVPPAGASIPPAAREIPARQAAGKAPDQPKGHPMTDWRKCFVLREQIVDLGNLRKGEVFRLGAATQQDTVMEKRYYLATEDAKPCEPEGNAEVKADIVGLEMDMEPGRFRITERVCIKKVFP